MLPACVRKPGASGMAGSTMPLVIFAVVCQAATVIISLIVEQLVASWLSILTFGVLYFIAYGVAWKLTVWVVDKRLAHGANGSSA
jgi:hypothetical protein